MAGRPPKPTALKILQGNPGRRPLNQQEPKPGIGAKMPAYLLKLPRALANWREEAPMLEELGVLTRADGKAFGRLCILWAEYEDGVEEGRPSDTRLLAEIRQLEGRFGMTPADRVRIKAEPQKPESKLKRFTDGRRQA